LNSYLDNQVRKAGAKTVVKYKQGRQIHHVVLDMQKRKKPPKIMMKKREEKEREREKEMMLRGKIISIYIEGLSNTQDRF
jgi:ribosomal protein S1